MSDWKPIFILEWFDTGFNSYMGIKHWGDNKKLWIFRKPKHPESMDWVSVREATVEDLDRLGLSVDPITNRVSFNH